MGRAEAEKPPTSVPSQKVTGKRDDQRDLNFACAHRSVRVGGLGVVQAAPPRTPAPPSLAFLEQQPKLMVFTVH